MYLVSTHKRMKDRIKNFIEAKGLSAGELAAVLDVQRSNISHILNGRNKPGASFIEKLLLEFPDLNARWLLTGEGDMFNQNNTESITTQQTFHAGKEKDTESSSEKEPEKENKASGNILNQKFSLPESEIERMIIIYRDGTFKIYNQRL